MEPSRTKKQLLMQSYILPQRPDVPAIFESLNDDTLTTVLEFVGNKSYAIYARINKHCKEVYLATNGMTKETFLYGYAPLSVIIDKIEKILIFHGIEFESVGKGVVLYNRRDVLDWALQQRNEYVLNGICRIAAKEEKIDLLNEVWNKEDWDEDDKEDIFDDLDVCAAEGGKIEVLKWIETKGLFIDEEDCAETAAYYGQLHILKWLQKEKGFQLDDGLYYHAIEDGVQLHVMKWLRENKVPWYESTFKYAAMEGNLDILQWLHDERCPWDRSIHIYEDRRLIPEVIDWLMSNGYGDRIRSY